MEILEVREPATQVCEAEPEVEKPPDWSVLDILKQQQGGYCSQNSVAKGKVVGDEIRQVTRGLPSCGAL